MTQLGLVVLLLLQPVPSGNLNGSANGEQHLLYVAAPGLRNDLQYGGAGILVFDINRGHAFLRRIDTPASRQPKPEAIKGSYSIADA